MIQGFKYERKNYKINLDQIKEREVIIYFFILGTCFDLSIFEIKSFFLIKAISTNF